MIITKGYGNGSNLIVTKGYGIGGLISTVTRPIVIFKRAAVPVFKKVVNTWRFKRARVE